MFSFFIHSKYTNKNRLQNIFVGKKHPNQLLIILGEGCTGEDGNGFCFLEFVNNPDNPSENCFPDAQFSKSHGKFWSNLACAPPPEPIPEPPTLPPRAPPFDDFVEISGTKTKLNGPPAPPLSGQRIISAPAPPKRNIN